VVSAFWHAFDNLCRQKLEHDGTVALSFAKTDWQISKISIIVTGRLITTATDINKYCKNKIFIEANYPNYLKCIAT
jgi:hypothetical protein